VDRESVARWVEAYETAWRAPGTDQLGDLFSPDVRYRPSPWAPAVGGLEELARFWEAERDGPNEQFVFTQEVLAVEGTTAVVRVSVDYLGRDTTRWRDLWVLEFATDGRCAAFEEWPFAPGQRDGHESAG
jgi:ketosteroid isomerase-like protein